VSQRLSNVEERVCSDCGTQFTTNWAQRLCNPCKYGRAARDTCETCGQKTGVSGRKRCAICRWGPAPVLHPMTSAELTWLAAIIEGEGTYVFRRAYGGLRVVMTDQDIIERLRSLTGLGLVRALRPRMPHHKPPWAWDVMRYEAAALIASATAPFMLNRRRERMGAILERCGQSLPSCAELRTGTPQAWAWVAGLIEGEGWISPGPQTKSRKPVVAASSTDKDVLDRLRYLVGDGAIYPLKPRKSSHKPSWQWSVGSRRGVYRVLGQILPMLGARRSERAKYVLCGEWETRTPKALVAPYTLCKRASMPTGTLHSGRCWDRTSARRQP
jgi:hypothetical protein